MPGAAAEVEGGRRLAVEHLEAGEHPVVAGRDLLDLERDLEPRAAPSPGARGSSGRPACRWPPPRSGCAGRRPRRRRRRRRAPRWRASAGRPGSSRPASARRRPPGFRNDRSGFWPMARTQASASSGEHVLVVVAGAKRPFSSKTDSTPRSSICWSRPSPEEALRAAAGQEGDALLLRLLELLVPLRRLEHRHLGEALERDDRDLGGAAAQRGAGRVEGLLHPRVGLAGELGPPPPRGRGAARCGRRRRPRSRRRSPPPGGPGSCGSRGSR